MHNKHYYAIVRSDSDNSFEHRSHKYIKRERKSNGKYRYWYPSDLKKSSQTSMHDRLENSLYNAGKKLDTEYNKRVNNHLTKEQEYYRDSANLLKTKTDELGYRSASKANMTKAKYYWNQIKKSSDLGTKYYKKLANSLVKAATNKVKEYATKGKYYLQYLVTDVKRVNNGTSKLSQKGR